jgi:hypothetical protein
MGVSSPLRLGAGGLEKAIWGDHSCEVRLRSMMPNAAAASIGSDVSGVSRE